MILVSRYIRHRPQSLSKHPASTTSYPWRHSLWQHLASLHIPSSSCNARPASELSNQVEDEDKVSPESVSSNRQFPASGITSEPRSQPQSSHEIQPSSPSVQSSIENKRGGETAKRRVLRNSNWRPLPQVAKRLWPKQIAGCQATVASTRKWRWS